MLVREFPLVRGFFTSLNYEGNKPYVVFRKEGEQNVTVLVQWENVDGVKS
jgi:hypothetical protein